MTSASETRNGSPQNTSQPDESPQASARRATRQTTRLRLLVVAFFLIAPPLVAIPAVGDWLDRRLRPPNTDDLSPPALPPKKSDALKANGRSTAPSNPPNLAVVQPSSPRGVEIQTELQGLGANYMLLERYDEGGQVVYRFICHIERSSGGKRFEARSAESNEAMEQVLRAVHNWSETQ